MADLKVSLVNKGLKWLITCLVDIFFQSFVRPFNIKWLVSLYIKLAIPFGQDLRVRICHSDVRKDLRNFQRVLSVNFWSRKFQRQGKRSRGSLHQDIRMKMSERMPVVVSFHPALSGVGNYWVTFAYLACLAGHERFFGSLQKTT